MQKGKVKTKKNGYGRCIVLCVANLYLAMVLVGWKFYDERWHLTLAKLDMGVLSLESFLIGNESDRQTQNTHDLLAVTANLSKMQVTKDRKRTKTVTSPFAYAFVIGGCNPESPTYRFYLYNIMVSSKILRDYGSKSDVVAFFQLAWNTTSTRLPHEEEQVLRSLNIRLFYIPKSPHENFYRTNLDKFRVLGLTDYQRVLFLDGDVIPLENLDFLFELSTNGTIKENFVVRGKTEPANGGFFMLKPNRTHLEHVNAIVQSREAEARNGSLFDTFFGWGHRIQPGDEWRALHRIGELTWTFHGAFADQGLLYYWLKYVRSCVTIFGENGVMEHWDRDRNGTLIKNETENPYPKTRTQIFGNVLKRPPDRGYFHFTGTAKPWFTDPANFNRSNLVVDRAIVLWQNELQDIARAQNLSVNFSSWSYDSNRPALGMTPYFESIRTSNSDLLADVYE